MSHINKQTALLPVFVAEVENTAKRTVTVRGSDTISFSSCFDKQ